MPSEPKRGQYHISRGEGGYHPKGEYSKDYYEIWHEHPDKPGHVTSVGGAEVSYTRSTGGRSYAHWNAGEDHQPFSTGKGQGQLFRMNTHKPAATVELMEMTRGARHVVPALLGAMQNRAWDKGYPEGLSTPTDLSPHSSKLIGGLQKRGVVDKNAASEVTNDMDWTPEPPKDWYRPTHIENVLPDSEMRQGMKTTRSMIRAARTPRAHLSEQLQLFTPPALPHPLSGRLR